MGTAKQLLEKFERTIIVTMLFFLALVIAVGTIELFVLFLRRFNAVVSEISNVAEFQEALQNGFGGVLLVLLGLELMETVKAYFTEHRVRLEVVFVVAMIAVGRHIILLDPSHAGGTHLAGFGGLVLALALGYYLVRRTRSEDPKVADVK